MRKLQLFYTCTAASPDTFTALNPLPMERIQAGTRLLLGDAVQGQPPNAPAKGDYFLRVWIAELGKWGLYRPGRGVDPNELPNAVMSTEGMIESGFTINPRPAPDPHDQCFIYTKEKLWLAVPKGIDPAVRSF